MKDKTRVYVSVTLFAIVFLSMLLLSGIVSGKGMLYEYTGWLVLGVIVLGFGLLYLLVLMYLADETDILPRHVAAAGIAGMALLFFVSWIWYDRRGAPE